MLLAEISSLDLKRPSHRNLLAFSSNISTSLLFFGCLYSAPHHPPIIIPSSLDFILQRHSIAQASGPPLIVLVSKEFFIPKSLEKTDRPLHLSSSDKKIVRDTSKRKNWGLIPFDNLWVPVLAWHSDELSPGANKVVV